MDLPNVNNGSSDSKDSGTQEWPANGTCEAAKHAEAFRFKCFSGLFLIFEYNYLPTTLMFQLNSQEALLSTTFWTRRGRRCNPSPPPGVCLHSYRRGGFSILTARRLASTSAHNFVYSTAQ